MAKTIDFIQPKQRIAQNLAQKCAYLNSYLVQLTPAIP